MRSEKPNIKYLNHIPVVPKREMILARIGYKRDATLMDGRHIVMIEEGMKLGQLLCDVKGAYGRFAITNKSPLHLELEKGIVFESEGLSKLLVKSSEVVLMASTAGKTVTERISREIDNGRPALGVILDSVASQTADAGLSWMMDFLNKMLVREGKKLTRHRYSPGFGDLSLSYQRVIFDALKLEKLDMSLTDSFMLVPEKSVIAIAGIEDA